MGQLRIGESQAICLGVVELNFGWYFLLCLCLLPAGSAKCKRDKLCCQYVKVLFGVLFAIVCVFACNLCCYLLHIVELVVFASC